MRKLLKYLRGNKQKVFITIGVIVFIYVCIQIANNFVKEEQKAQEIESQNRINNIQTAQEITKPSESVLTQTTLNENKAEENAQIIKSFVEYCNAKQVEQAYNLLSDNCKEELYKDSNLFSQNYIEQIFNLPKTYKLELWLENTNCYTYKITYLEGNALQTGGYNTNHNFVDYITIVKQGTDTKLNISKLIDKTTYTNKLGSNQNVEIQINSKTVYMDYETYNITIRNRADKTILLNNGKEANKVVVIDNHDIQYQSLIYEIPANSLAIDAQYQRTLNIKFNKIYNANSKAKKMQIKDIYLDKEKYDTNLNGTQENEKIEIKIDL